MARYKQDDGEWFEVPAQIKQQCCSCSLVHVIDFRRRKKDGIMEIRFLRDERATAAARRKRKKSVVIVDE